MAICNDNHTYENRFKVIFDSEDYRHLTRNITNISLPGLTIGNTIQPTRVRNIYIPGNSIEFTDITVTYILNEDYSNYRDFILWLNALRGFDENNAERDVIDITVVLLNGKHNPFIEVRLNDCYPYEISDIPLDYQISTVVPVKFTVVFKINGFSII